MDLLVVDAHTLAHNTCWPWPCQLVADGASTSIGGKHQHLGAAVASRQWRQRRAGTTGLCASGAGCGQAPAGGEAKRGQRRVGAAAAQQHTRTRGSDRGGQRDAGCRRLGRRRTAASPATSGRTPWLGRARRWGCVARFVAGPGAFERSRQRALTGGGRRDGGGRG